MSRRFLMLSRALLISPAPPPTAVSPTPLHCPSLPCAATPRSTPAASLLQPFPARSPPRDLTFVRLPSGVCRARHLSVHSGGGGGGMGDGVADVSYLTQKEAAEIDEILMGPLGFSVDQLMVSLLPRSLSSRE
ncbi:hypothetical protein Taro_025018 [Colocasia esculenta]|uniref:Uncharacterized protein n=1 Tax=Colocasia esculenta TaxID=4460 RepID=A0A843VB18_COLES|nr:hypothetical protein [Colocasia esculenta]